MRKWCTTIGVRSKLHVRSHGLKSSLQSLFSLLRIDLSSSATSLRFSYQLIELRREL